MDDLSDIFGAPIGESVSIHDSGFSNFSPGGSFISPGAANLVFNLIKAAATLVFSK